MCVCGCKSYFCRDHHASFYWFNEDHMFRYWHSTKGAAEGKQYFDGYEGVELARLVSELLDQDSLLVV